MGLTARRGDRLAALAEELCQGFGNEAATWEVADAADFDQTRLAVKALECRLGEVDLLIANAGQSLRTPGASYRVEELEQLVRVNYLGAACAIEAILPSLKSRGTGQIVGISSLAGFRGFPGSFGYCATKAALTTFLQGLRVELRLLGITVTTVHPGYVTTEMTSEIDHRLPFLMTAERAARIIRRGVERKRRVINFPWPSLALLRVVQAMPDPLFEWTADRLTTIREGG